MLATGVERIIEQVVDAQIQHLFLPRIETVVKEYLHSDNAPPPTSNGQAAEASKPGMEGGVLPPQPGLCSKDILSKLDEIQSSMCNW